MKYLIVIEETKTGYSAFSPDIPGCVATGNKANEVEKEMRKAIIFHVEGMLQEHMDIPAPHTYSKYLEISA